jgi:hypothetical protein
MAYRDVVANRVDVADGANGLGSVLNPRAYSDRPGSRSPLAAESYFNAQHAKQRLRTTQAAGERAGIFVPAGTAPRSTVAGATGAGTQKVDCGPCPQATLGHDLSATSGTGSASIITRSQTCDLPHKRGRRSQEAKRAFRRPLPRAQNRPSAAGNLGQSPAVRTTRARPNREGRRGCGDVRVRIAETWCRPNGKFGHWRPGCQSRRDTRRHTYHFFRVALAVLPRTTFAATVVFDALAGSAERAAAALVRRTPG